MQCGGSKIASEVYLAFQNIDEAFPGSFMEDRVEIYKNLQEKPDGLTDYRRGLYGARVSLEIFEFRDPALSSAFWLKKKNFVLSADPVLFREKSTTEHRLDYETPEGYAGKIWTQKSFVMAAEADSPSTLKQFLYAAGLKQ